MKLVPAAPVGALPSSSAAGSHSPSNYTLKRRAKSSWPRGLLLEIQRNCLLEMQRNCLLAQDGTC
ncbi:hypothetical protein PVAP13_6NG248212 [Panicum virgatum]|uniref:Uncharacterized protein n=1 Tax=Panicum virgatum TaxID=38727 RepID=A0A8T0R0N6_PANVG|nr:hypothetical protein PVAP13_6NG248212 [Panicum virgatum]